ncbi:unnamed protein product [Gongylonema pulchrum]|uniref:UBX domain-containing protein n=1 Tax=Gongylonema pulchrum TaxID=637853 RepID=A0A183E9E7_9BILA|nr:unnamed protein product [Gongylonema pulchrum]
MSSDEELGTGNDVDAEGSRLMKRHLDDATEYEGEEDEQKAVLPNQKDEFVEVLDDSEIDESNETGEQNDNANESKYAAERVETAEKTRIQAVIGISPLVKDYKFDVKSNRWCIITFQLPLSTKTRLDVGALVERELENFLIWETPGIEKCIALMKHSDVLDVNTLYSNDLNMICANYGIEACGQALVKVSQH